MFNGYNANSGSLTSQAMAGFFASSGDAITDSESRQTIVERARYLNTCSTTARALHDCLSRAVVGSGIRYEEPKNSDFFNYDDAEIKTKFNRISHTRFLDARHRLTLTQMEHLVFQTMIISGECWLFRKGSSWIIKEPDDIKTPKTFEQNGNDNLVQLDNGNYIIDGIELKDGIPVACYLCEKDDAGEEKWERIPFKDESGLMQVLQVFMQERPEQVRGLPLTAPVIPQLWSCLAYAESETQMAMLQTNMSLIITTGTNPTVNPFGGISVRDLDAPLIPEKDASKKESEFSWIPPQGESGFYGLIDKANFIKPGQTRHLAEGEDIKFVSPTAPHTGFTNFCDFMIRQIGASVGIPYQVLTQSFDSNFSAVRGAVSAFNHTTNRYRKVLIENFLKPIFEVFLHDIISDNEICELLAMESQWLPNDSRLNIDPTREIDFYIKGIDAGLISPDEASELLFSHPAYREVNKNED